MTETQFSHYDLSQSQINYAVQVCILANQPGQFGIIGRIGYQKWGPDGNIMDYVWIYGEYAWSLLESPHSDLSSTSGDINA